MNKIFIAWAKREFNPRTIRGWWLFSRIAPFWCVYMFMLGSISPFKIVTILNVFASGALLVTWTDSFTFRRYRRTCDRYGDMCNRYQAELEKAHMATGVAQAMLKSALEELARHGIFMTNVQVHIHPNESNKPN